MQSEWFEGQKTRRFLRGGLWNRGAALNIDLLCLNTAVG
jgi:hypothetical protein